jgi:hypothetical protein
MKKAFEQGDVIRTNPKEGYWGIAVVLSEKEKTEEFLPMCHIAITPLVFTHEVQFEDLDLAELKPLEFKRVYKHIPDETLYKMETLIGVYTRRNKAKLHVIGMVDPSKVYSGPLPFSPDYGLEVTWPLCGDTSQRLGSDAIVNYERNVT